MGVRIGVVVFPGSNCDRDTVHALDLAGAEPVVLWHEQASLEGVAAVILPGGFAYGDYLRAGRHRPVQPGHARRDGLRRTTAASSSASATASRSSPRPHLVPGALLRNASLRFAGQEVRIAAERLDTPFTHALEIGRPLRMPIAHGEGCYFADDAALDALEAADGVLFRYVDADGAVAGPDDPANPNGSLRAIAGVINAAGNVAGLMPHPERAAEAILGSDDGAGIIRSLVESARGVPPTADLVAVGGR